MAGNRRKRNKAGIIWLFLMLIRERKAPFLPVRHGVRRLHDRHFHSVGKLIGNIVIPEYRSWPEDKQEQFAEKIDFPVRKCAHASEYAVLGVLMLGTAYSFAEDQGKKNRLLCWCAGTAYAATDEFHQLFVPGRSCQFRDVCIDSAGILTGIVLFSLIKHQIAKYNEKKKVAKNVKNQGKSLDKNHDS